MLLVGKLWFEYSGQAEIINHKLNIRCKIYFKPYSWYTRLINRVEGCILDADSKVVLNLAGQWDQFFYSSSDISYTKFFSDTQALLNNDQMNQINRNEKDRIELVWKTDLNPTDTLEKYYNFTKFTCSLNQLTDKLKKILPPTDSRLRPDIRLLEDGEVDKASSEKHRIEEKQREKRKLLSEKNESFTPLWFKIDKHPVNGQEAWLFKNTYWKRDFQTCPDIF